MTMPPLPADTDLDLEPDADGESGAPARSDIQSIEVGFRLLEVFTYITGLMMPRDLVRAASMNPAKAYRYLASFARLGLAMQTSEGHYDLGLLALGIGLVSLNRQDLMRRTRPAVAASCDEIDHTVGLAVWGNQGPAIIHWEGASYPVTVSSRLGDVMPMLNSATGRVFGAYLSRAQTRSFIQRELDRIVAQGESADSENPELPQMLETYNAICADVRPRGISCVHGGMLPGTNMMLLPVFGTNG